MSAKNPRVHTNGGTFTAALDAIKPLLDKAERRETIHNATQIIRAVLTARGKGTSATGLVYGKIQSGKTRAMITSSALAFGNGFRIVAVITSNNTRLVDQTSNDFKSGLPTVRVFSKAHFSNERDQAKQILESSDHGIVIVCSKGPRRLNQIIEFLKKIKAERYPALIFDDEGDQATLDTHTSKRSKGATIAPSTIHSLIHSDPVVSLRKALPDHVFVSVTGTPQGIVLQNVDSRSRPSFIELLEPGKSYVGGDVFFRVSDPSKNTLISLTDQNERGQLLAGAPQSIPEGLKKAIRFFLLAAAWASQKSGWPPDEGYYFLCHPSVRNADQQKVDHGIRNYLNQLSPALSNTKHALYRDLKESYLEVKKNKSAPSLKHLLKVIQDNIHTREINLINKNTTNTELPRSTRFNFLIGGNTLGRGLAIKNLLVTYYVRESARTQMDTMYQHARMFGYRNKTLPFTKVFLPPQLYSRFRQVYLSDEELRRFIKDQNGRLKTYLIQLSRRLKPTRSNVLDAKNIDYLIPGRQIYPNYPYVKYPLAEKLRKVVLAKLREIYPDFSKEGKGKKIPVSRAVELVTMIKTMGTNKWNDKNMPTILSNLGKKIILRFREAERTLTPDGALEQGVLAGSAVAWSANQGNPVLWLFDVKEKGSNNKRFIFPTIVIPRGNALTVFNRS